MPHEKTIILKDEWWYDDEDEGNYYCIGDIGHIRIVYNNLWNEELVRIEYKSDAENVVRWMQKETIGWLEAVMRR